MIRVDFTKFRKGDYYCRLAPCPCYCCSHWPAGTFHPLLSPHRCWPSLRSAQAECSQARPSASADKPRGVVSIRQVFTFITHTPLLGADRPLATGADAPSFSGQALQQENRGNNDRQTTLPEGQTHGQGLSPELQCRSQQQPL